MGGWDGAVQPEWDWDGAGDYESGWGQSDYDRRDGGDGSVVVYCACDFAVSSGSDFAVGVVCAGLWDVEFAAGQLPVPRVDSGVHEHVGFDRAERGEYDGWIGGGVLHGNTGACAWDDVEWGEHSCEFCDYGGRRWDVGDVWDSDWEWSASGGGECWDVSACDGDWWEWDLVDGRDDEWNGAGIVRGAGEWGYGDADFWDEYWGDLAAWGGFRREFGGVFGRDDRGGARDVCERARASDWGNGGECGWESDYVGKSCDRSGVNDDGCGEEQCDVHDGACRGDVFWGAVGEWDDGVEPFAVACGGVVSVWGVSRDVSLWVWGADRDGGDWGEWRDGEFVESSGVCGDV